MFQLHIKIDIIASALDTDAEILAGEASPQEIPRLVDNLKTKASCCPALQGKRITCALWIMKGVPSGAGVITAVDVVTAMK